MTACAACGTKLRAAARFCDECGAPTAASHPPAEYKQVTVLFADVVHSMDIAAAVGAERLREVMAELFAGCAAVVRRYGGTVDKFIGDAIMAVFGAPVALEDHALRGCLAALEIQRQSRGLAEEVQRRDGIALQLRVGLNSGRVVAGELGSNPMSYTAFGEHVGLAQRMESVAPPDGVMLSESTARLVEDVATLGEPELVQIKGADTPVPVRRLLAASVDRRNAGRRDPALVGRSSEKSALTGMLDAAIDGTGCVVGVVGPPGIGKSRIVREISAIAQRQGMEVFATYCESHASEIPLHAVTSLLRTALRVNDVADGVARAQIRERAPEADPEDLLLLDDLLGIRDSEVELPAIDPDARRRRLTRLVNTVSLARTKPALVILEDAHWIDEISELLLTDLLTVVRQTPLLVLVTYRPEYHGALSCITDAQTIGLTPLNDSESSVLITALLGPDPSVSGLATLIAARIAGNPFFAQEIVRDLAERGVLRGSRGAYLLVGEPDVAVPATLQATIAARIDRLDHVSKRTLNAAAVIGMRFDAEELTLIGDGGEMGELIVAELVDQVRFTPYAEYVFHHPLIRIVAYESQLKSDRAEVHRRLAAVIEHRHPDALDENAALIGEHLEAAGELQAAFGWHMRAGAWAQYRDIRAARVSWGRAQHVADRLPADDPDRASMRIGPRTLLCGSASWVNGAVPSAGFNELRGLCTAAGDTVSLAIGMAGLMSALVLHHRFRESARVASDCSRLLESIGDPVLTVGIAGAPSNAMWQAGEVVEALRLAQRVIDVAQGDPAMGNLLVGSPLAFAFAYRGSNRYCLGVPGWKDDLDRAMSMARSVDATSYVLAVLCKYGFAVHLGVWLPGTAADRDTAEALEMAENAGGDFALDFAQLSRGLVLVSQEGSQRSAGWAKLTQYREAQLQQGYSQAVVRFADIEFAKEKARLGDVDGAVELAGAVVDYLFDAGEMITRGEATRILVESLLQRGSNADLAEAQTAIDRLAAVPTDPGYVLFEIPLLRMRALLARANGNEAGYRDFSDRYLKQASEVGYEGHVALAEAMT